MRATNNRVESGSTSERKTKFAFQATLDVEVERVKEELNKAIKRSKTTEAMISTR